MNNLNSLANQIFEIHQHQNIKVLSFDVFDTLLLRNQKFELFRFYEVSKLYTNYLKTYLNISFDEKEIFIARLLAFRTIYRVIKHNCGIREGNFLKILKLMLNILGIQKDKIKFISQKLLEIELNYELKNLSLNPLINELFKMSFVQNFSLIWISDMYFSSQEIKQLVDYFYPNIYFSKFYSSANYSLTKSSGLLYELVLNDLSLDRSQLLHIGDNFKSDIQMSKLQGISALHLPIAKDEQRFREIEKKKFKEWLNLIDFDLNLFW